MGWIVYSKDGQTEKCVLHKLEYSGTFMGDRTVIATFSSEKKIDFSVFDYITYRGERFELELLPTVKKVSSYEYKYELRFVSLKYELERCMMRNIVPGDNGIVYPTPLSVEFTGDVKYLAERIQACLDAMYGKGAWSITIAESTESEEKNISMSNQNCWDALSLVNTEYKLNYFIKGRNVIIGGEEPVVDNVFEYGKGKGLYEIERISDTDTGVVTKLRAYGGTRNLDYSYPKLPDWEDSVLPANYALSPLRLMLPSFKADGKTDYVLASEEAIAKYGIREGTITYDDIYPSITGMKNSSGQAIDEIKSVSAITNETQPTFTVGLYDLGFDLNESLTTDEAQMSMKSGSLQGYTFNITKIERASDGSYTLTLGRNTLEKEDTGNFTVPNKDWNMKAGDKFVLLNILMPQAYIRDAENRLLARAKEYLAKYSSTNYSYNVGVDEIFMARNVNFYNDIMEGKRLTVNDQEIGINNENIIIQSLTIKEGEGIVPTFEVTLNNETTASTLDRIQGQISEVETSVSNNFSSQSELLKQYRKKLDKSVWDSIFVIHKDDSENPEKITSVQSLVGLWTNEFLSAKGLNPGSGGGSGEGGATALYQLNDVAKNASETGVLGAGPGKVLTYGTDGKWYAADAVGLDETALGKYLTDNNYAQKSDIPSLSGYATQSWVLGKNYITSDALSGYATQSWVNSQGYATASSLKAVSDKLNDFLEGSDTDGIINKWKELEAFLAGQTQTSTLADLLAVKADKATTLSGYGITDAYTKTEVNTKLGSYVTTTALNTALAKKVDVAFLAKVFGFIGEDSSEVSINDMGSVITSIKAKFGLWTDEYLSSKGLNPNAGGGSGEGATALYQLNDVSQNASGTGVLGAETGKVLTYGSDGKWYAAKAGMDEDALSSYLTENNYAQKSDIPSLNGYATQSWVNTALEKKVDKVSGMGLSHNDFTDTLLQKLNGIAEGANKYILPIAKAAVLGGVMIGSTLTASATGVLDLPEVAVAGTYAKVTTDVYGRVTAGYSLSASDIPALGISKITGLQAALDNKVNKADFVTEFDKAMQRWFVRDTANKGLHPADYDSEAVGIYSDSYMSAKGVNTGAGGSAGGASSLGELNNVGSWADDIPTVDRIMVQRKGETHWESLNLSDIGLNETQLSDYLTTNNYAKKSDIPSLSGYATQAWVNTKLADYATTSSVTTLLAEKVDKVEGKGLSANDFTDTLLNKLNGIEAGANKYVLPTASGSVLGGVKVGTTLSIANGVLNLKSGIATAGTYTKVTVDTYGRVVSGDSLVSGDIPTLAISKISGLQTALDDKANKDGSNATGTWGISITGSSRRLYQAPLTNEDLNDYTYANHSGKMYYAGGGNTTVNSPSDAYGLMVWRIAAGYTGQIGFGSNNNLYKRRIDNNGVATGWMRIVDEGNFSTILDTRYVTKTFLARLFGAMDADGNEIAINNTSTVIDSIKAKVGLWTEQYLSSKGLNPNAGSGEGSDYNRLDAWDDYSTDKSGYVLSAGLGWDLNTRVSSLESKAITLTTSGTGNGLSGFTQNGNTVTFSKATFLTEHQSLAGYATESWVNNKGYLVATSADKANWNTAFGWGDHSKAGYATQLWVTSKDYATIADLDARINALVNGAPEAFDTLKEIADVLQGNVNQIEDLLTAIGTKADKTITISAGTGLNGGGTLTANRTINLSAATTKALGGIIVGDRLSIDSDGKLSATYTYTLPTASASVLGGVKVGTTLAISSGVLNLKAVGTAGTYFKTTTDAYGRVTAGSNPTTLAGFGITDGVNDVAYSGSGNAVTSATVSGHIITLVKGTTFLTKATFDDLFEKVNIGTASAPVYAIKAKYGLYTEQFLSSMGLNLGTGSGGGSDYDRLDTWTDYDASKAGWVLSAGLGNDLNTRVTSLENGAAVTVTPSGSGMVVKDVTKNGTVITVTKGDLAFGSLTGKPTTISGYGITDAYTKTQADDKYVLKSGSNMTGALNWTDADSGVYAMLLGTNHYIGIDGTSGSSMLHWSGTYTMVGSSKGSLILRSNANDLKHNYNGTEYVILDARNYNNYAPTKTGTGATGTWGIDVTGYSKRLYANQDNAVANTLMQGSGLYYNQVSSTTDTGYPGNYGHTIRWQRSTSSTLSSSQAVVDLFHATGASALNQLYLRTGYGDGSKMVWGSFVQLLHTGNYTSLITKLGTATVGSNTKFFYLNAGTPTASTATVGSSSLPVYMNAGTITQCSTTLGVSVTGYSKRLLETVLTNEDLDTYTYSSYSGRTYSAGGGNTVANKPEGVDSFGLLVLRSAGGYTTHLAVNGANLFTRYHNSTTWSDWYKFAFVTSNVASATKLQTARTINGTSFDGTANITTANWGTARNFTIGAATKSVNGSAAVSFNLNEINAAYGRNVTYTGTTTAQGWYRLASTGQNINTTNSLFFISVTVSGQHSTFLLQVSTNYGNNPSLIQLGGSNYSTASVDQFRLVYHTTYSGNYAYLEARSRGAMTSATFNVFLVGRANTTWNLSTALTAGNIPEGYTSKVLTSYSASIVAPTFRGALIGNVTGDLTGNVIGNLTGNASTATSLQTARTLWGQSFNGTANITGTLLGVESLVARSGRINNFSGYFDNSGNPATGTICITLPNGWTSSMNIYEIWIYEYNTTANASVITIGAYNYNGGGTASSAKWVNIGYHTKGAYSKGVRLAYNGSKCVILLGTTATTWYYPKVYLKTIYTGHSNQTIWGGTSTISLITSETGYTNIDTPARMDEFFGDTSVTGRLAVTGAGHFGYTYTTMTAGINVKGDSATTGISIYDGTGTTARLYRKGDILYITRGGNDNAGLLMNTAGSIYPGTNNALANGTSSNRWSNVYTQLLNVAGLATTSRILASGEIQSTSAKAFRAIYGSYGFFIYNDGNSSYFMLTAKDDQYGTYNSLRPLYINNSTGVVTMGNGTNIWGILNVTNTTDATTTTAAAIKTAGGLAVAKQLRVGGAATLSSSLYVTGSATFMGGIRIGDYWLRSTADGLELSHATSGKTAGLYTTGFLSSMGLNPGTGEGGGGSDYDRLDAWDDYSADKAGYVLSAKLGNDLNTRVKSLEGGSALTVKTSGSGNAVTSVDKAGTLITVTKGTTFVDLASAQTITGQKTFSSSILMGRSNLHYVNHASTTNATGLYWKTANYAATQFGIGCFTTNNASPRGFIGWTSEPWQTANNLTVSETSLTYKGNAILHSANYNTYAPTKTGGGASGSWGISITGNAATANTATKLGTATIGAANKPIYLNAGTPTALSSTVGDSTVPAYLNAGTVTVCSWGLAGASGKRARKSGYITSSTASLSSYWGKIASFNWGDTSNDRDITLYIHSAFNSLWGTVVIRTRWSSATSTVIDFRIINGNIPTSRLRLYYDVSAKDNVITLWGDVNAQWGAFNTYVLSETTRTSSETGDVTLYTTSFTTAQTLPTSTYKTPTYLSILNNADTATTLQTSRTIFGKSFNGSANVAGQALVYGTYQETASSRYSNGGLQIRENGMVGSAQTDDGYAPAIGFHWANRIGASLILTTSGFKFMNQAFTGYQNVYGIFKGNADSATQVYNTETNPTSGTWYNGTFVTSSTNGNKAIRSNDGFKYYTLEGTASAQGEAMLQLGTPTATGTAGNKRGRLVLYSSSSGYGIFVMTTTTGAYTFTFPAATGTVALTSSNVASATKLQTARTLWGQSFNGTANVSGSMTGVGPSIVATANLSITTTGENNNLSLKYNNDDTKSVVLNTSAFKPFDLATNKLNLGTSAARWLGLYANTGNFSSTVTGTRFISTVATGTAPLTVSSTTVVTNLNADMVDGIHSSNIPLEYDANYIPSGTAARWLRIAYFDYTGASYSWSGTFTITNSYSNNENTGIIFNVTTRHTTTSANVTPNITQVSGNSNIFTSIRLVKDTSTTYANVYLEVYYNSTSAGNRVYVSYKPANRSIGKWSLYSTYTAGSVPDNHTVIAQVTTTDGFATNQNIRAQGYLYVAGNATFNNRLIIQSDGKIVPYSTATRRSGVYGVYDAAKIGHIWSMGSAYQIADDGSTFGSLYGFAYKHTTNTTGGTMASGHQAVWCENGVPKVAIGSNLWVANNATISAVLYTDTLTIKNTEAVAHLKFSRGSYNYITAPASGNITFVVGGQAVGSATAELTIQNGSLIPGATNATSLGSSSLRWSNTYTQLLNVAGVATLSSTVNIAGVLNANNATDATSTTAAGAVFDGGVGIAKQLRVGGVVTLSSGLSAQYTGSSWITLATRGNIIYGSQNQTEASAHGLYRVKSFAGDAVVFGGLGNAIGFYGFYKARIDAGTNGSDWATTWNTTTGTLTHNKAMTVSGATTLNSTLTVASTGLFNLSTDATSTTAAAVRIVGGLAVGKQLRVGGAVTLSSTLAVTSTSTFTGKTTHNGGIGATTGTFSSTLSAAGVVSFTNATDATSTTAAAVKITGGLGIAKQLRVGGASTFSGTINTSVATFINLGANATDQKILKDVDGNGFYSGISFFGTKGSNMGVSDIMMNIYAGGAIQIHSQAGSGQILLNGTVHNNVGMYSDGYMSSKGLNDTSDMRLKNKGRDIFLSVKDMAHAPAFEYTWKDGTPGVMAGSSAQYWQKVLPPSVKIKKDGYMTMFYGHTALVATISLARHVETLEERVERLERENKEKDKRIKELERRISAWE